MRVLIENYRGFDIWFDTEKEIFYAASDSEDVGKEKRSYSAAIKYVDDFIKDNMVFEPFWVISLGGTKVRIVGIRKDGYFVQENKDGSKSQFSSWDERNYFEYIPEKQDSLFAKLNVINEKRAELEKEESAIEREILETAKKLITFKDKYLVK